jgi:hypothetical protein
MHHGRHVQANRRRYPLYGAGIVNDFSEARGNDKKIGGAHLKRKAALHPAYAFDLLQKRGFPRTVQADQQNSISRHLLHASQSKV